MLRIDYPRRSPNFLACRQAVRPLLSAHRQVVAGLSGGPDSLALITALLVEGADVEAVVVDHGLQPGSAEVADRAARQARALGARARVIAVDVPAGGDGTEAEARAVRYHALFDAAGPRPVVVGHTRNDQAETLLLTALRGQAAGMAGVTGQVHRPFLTVTRENTVGACQELGLEYWDDPHNTDRAYRRVAVRHEVMPLMNRIVGGDVTDALATAADRLARDHALLDTLAGAPTDDCAELAAQPEPLRRRRIAAWLRHRGAAVTTAVVAGVDTLVTDYRGQGGVACGHAAGRRLEVRRIGGKLAIVRQE